MITRYNIQPDTFADLANTLQIKEVLAGSATGALSGGVYTSTTTIYFKKTKYKNPQICLAFKVENYGTDTEEISLLPDATTTFYSGLIGGIFDGYICTKWTRAESYRNRIEIQTYSTAAYTENYLIYVIQDKLGKLR